MDGGFACTQMGQIRWRRELNWSKLVVALSANLASYATWLLYGQMWFSEAPQLTLCQRKHKTSSIIHPRATQGWRVGDMSGHMHSKSRLRRQWVQLHSQVQIRWCRELIALMTFARSVTRISNRMSWLSAIRGKMLCDNNAYSVRTYQSCQALDSPTLGGCDMWEMSIRNPGIFWLILNSLNHMNDTKSGHLWFYARNLRLHFHFYTNRLDDVWSKASISSYSRR